LLDTFQRLVVRNPKRTEAEIQADVRQFILSAPFELEPGDLQDVNLESPVGDRRRIDVEAGSTVIEVKRDLRKEKPKKEAEEQLAGYVDSRMIETGLRYVGVLTDGTEWNCYNLLDGKLQQISELTLEKTEEDEDRLIVWLEGVLATTQGIAPSAHNIEERLGTESTAYKLDRASLATLYQKNKKAPTIAVKRKLWSQLLLSALGTQFKDDDDLFVDHTLLVNTSEIIAHAVLGLQVQSLSPTSLLSGDKFAEAGVYGVVESDFFDWVLEVEGGETFIRTLAKRLMRFVWSDVNQDVLKILYENIIGTETRKKLGEYYTPDWLAEVMVTEKIREPLSTRVLDPACGSGTFLFYAVRQYLSAAESQGQTIDKLLAGATRHVVGMDLHPVAVTLARVTYLLAIGKDKLIDPNRGNIQVPVYLGDSIQWREQSVDLWSAGNLVIHTQEQHNLFESDLSFPDALLDDASVFDQLVNDLADKSSKRKPNSPVPSLKAVFQRLSIPKEYQETVEKTFKTMCLLHDEGRDHIWGYYIRNLARPLWLSKPGNQVDMIIGNPPWLAYSYMTAEMQNTFRSMSESRGLWAGAQLSPHQDLSALFVTRACELYLKKGGHFALVLPNAALDREHYAGFRNGTYHGEHGFLALDFAPSWDLRRLRPHFFPRASSVVFGARLSDPEVVDADAVPQSHTMPEDAEIWTGKIEAINVGWKVASTWLKRTPGKVRQLGESSKSPYAPSFTQGATILPLFAFFVNEKASSSIGLAHGKVAVESRRTKLEKKPWKNLPPIKGVIEKPFLRPMFAGEHLFPFCVGKPLLAVIPCDDNGLLSDEQIELHKGLHEWWRHATDIWEKHRSTERLSLTQQIDFQSKLSKQLPIAPFRVIYNKSGMHICAAKLRNKKALLTTGLYWAPSISEQEADYLCAILNAPITTELARPLMSYGKDERDIHKHVWELPIQQFDPHDAVHQRIAALGAILEKLASTFKIDENLHFAATRRHIRDFTMDTSAGQELNGLVSDMLE
jgi:type I restriction-modification system DNA methylase subunit